MGEEPRACQPKGMYANESGRKGGNSVLKQEVVPVSVSEGLVPLQNLSSLLSRMEEFFECTFTSFLCSESLSVSSGG